MMRFLQPWLHSDWPGSAWLTRRWLAYAQARTERWLARERRQMVVADEQLEKSLSFSGQAD